MDAPTPTAHPQPLGALPPHLEEKLRTCEVIAARMSVLQQQVDAEIQQLDRAQHDEPITSFYASPAILSAVNKLLRWIREKVAIH